MAKRLLHNVKFLDTEVYRLREQYFEKEISVGEIGEVYSVGFESVRRMLRGETYAHVPMPPDPFIERSSAPYQETRRALGVTGVGKTAADAQDSLERMMRDMAVAKAFSPDTLVEEIKFLPKGERERAANEADKVLTDWAEGGKKMRTISEAPPADPPAEGTGQVNKEDL